MPRHDAQKALSDFAKTQWNGLPASGVLRAGRQFPVRYCSLGMRRINTVKGKGAVTSSKGKTPLDYEFQVSQEQITPPLLDDPSATVPGLKQIRVSRAYVWAIVLVLPMAADSAAAQPPAKLSRQGSATEVTLAAAEEKDSYENEADRVDHLVKLRPPG